jgi:hypothetical protein
VTFVPCRGGVIGSAIGGIVMVSLFFFERMGGCGRFWLLRGSIPRRVRV